MSNLDIVRKKLNFLIDTSTKNEKSRYILVNNIHDYIKIINETPELSQFIDLQRKNTHQNYLSASKIYDNFQDYYKLIEIFTNKGILQDTEKIKEHRLEDNRLFNIERFNLSNNTFSKKLSFESILLQHFIELHKKIILYLEDIVISENQLVESNKNYWWLEDNGATLRINNYLPIKIAERKEETYPLLLLNYLSSEEKNNPGKKHFFDEILEKAFFDGAEDKRRKCHTACEAIKRKILRDTKNKVDDFLDFSNSKRGFVKVNQKYLLRSPDNQL